jgi:hypothetical protein
LDPPQLSLDGAGATEQSPVHLAEIIIRGIEDEAAGHPNGDPDGAPVELDRETLDWH